MEETIATRLAKVVKDQGLSVRGLAIKAGLKSTAVRDILNGRSKRPRIETLFALCKTLDIRMEDLVPSNDLDEIYHEFTTSIRYKNRQSSAIELFGNQAKYAGRVLFGSKAKSDEKPVNLSGANLAGASFVGGLLRGANLSHANLAFTNFTRCDLRQANFQSAVFYKTIFVEADLREANLEGVDLSEAIFIGDETMGDIPKS